MNSHVGDVILTLRRAANMTQDELASALNVTQVTLSRWENDLRTPDVESLEKIGEVLGVTAEFLQHDFRLRGAIAADAHMRRQKTTKPSDWKRVEARLNSHRMHTTFLLERVPMSPPNHVIQIDPEEHSPSEAAAMLRAAWRLPIGPIRNLTRWIESAGIIVVEEHFGTHRIDGMSQWASDHAVIVINSGLPTDRKRLTLAHELGHLVLHSYYMDSDVEDQANEFAAELLMPEHVIKPELVNLTLGKLSQLKKVWGVSMQAIFERAYRLGRATPEERGKFYRQLNSRGWKTKEPGSEDLPAEKPSLAISLRDKLSGSGLTAKEISRLTGFRAENSNPLMKQDGRHLRAV